MSNGDPGETVTVQDRLGDESEGSGDSAGSAESVEPAGGTGVSTDISTESTASAELITPANAPADSISAEGVPIAVDKSDAVDEPLAVDEPAVDGPVVDRSAVDQSAEDSVATGAPAEPARSSRGTVRDLEEEGEVAADYLEELLDIVDVDGDIDIDVENGRASLAIVAEGGSDRSLRRLVGANGEVLEALQELTRLAVQASTGERSRLMLDVAGHRAQRRKVLTDRATQACAEVKSSGKSLSLEPMSAFERKIVHDVVAGAGLESESEGVDPNRHVVILPAAS
jgi:spoIIIJ-associated protein